ncbi:hypothetical protein QBC44DRAFT_333279 [Cladorrhinum sp. PSN332]|nr:hypothetical protein QBC44DRAFT_333279 [Cladorrhinum sp. PSN332]
MEALHSVFIFSISAAWRVAALDCASSSLFSSCRCFLAALSNSALCSVFSLSASAAWRVEAPLRSCSSFSSLC